MIQSETVYRRADPQDGAIRFPKVVQELQINDDEVVRISLDQYKKSFTIDIRTWYRGPNGTFKPGTKGVTLTIKHLPKLARGIDIALQRAQQLGLVETGAKDRGVG